MALKRTSLSKEDVPAMTISPDTGEVTMDKFLITDQSPLQLFSNLGTQPLSEETIVALRLTTDEQVFSALLAIMQKRESL